MFGLTYKEKAEPLLSEHVIQMFAFMYLSPFLFQTLFDGWGIYIDQQYSISTF